MATWNDINASDPADSEAVSQGASRIRGHADAAKTTWGVEHQQTGEHNFPIAAPGTPLNNQIWFDLTNKMIRRYDGTDHTILNAAGFYAVTVLGSVAVPASETTLNSVLNVVIPVGGRLAIFYTTQYTEDSPAGELTTFKIKLSGSLLATYTHGGFGTVGANVSTFSAILGVAAGAGIVGTKTVEVTGQLVTGTPTVTMQSLVVVVL